MTLYETFTSFKTIVRKEVTRFSRIWTQTVIPPIITQTLYFLIFGKFIGSQINNINGISYMAFIVPGLIMMSVINNSFANVVSSFFSSKFQRSIEEIMVSPTPDYVIVGGYITGGLLRGITIGILVFLVSIFFAKPAIYRLDLILIFIFLTAVVASLGGLLNAIFAKSFDDISIFPLFVLTPLIYLGGVFYSINDLPPVWQAVSKLNPVMYLINGFRYGFYGISDINISITFYILISLVIGLVSLNLYLLKKGIGLRT